VVDWGRVPYRTRCRFFRDDETEDEIRWVEARPDAPPLPYTSIIVNSFNERDKELWEGVGEVWGEPRPYTGQRAPRGLDGDHVCGTAADFGEGGLYEPTVPPVAYDANGFARCCNGPKRLNGGAGAGGVTHPVIVSATPAPGNSCATGGVISADVLYTWVGDGSASANWVATIAHTTIYHVEFTKGIDGATLSMGAGPDCAHMGSYGTLFGDGCLATAGGPTETRMLLTINFSTIGHHYTFKVSAGPC
jgi:hypothetical protein